MVAPYPSIFYPSLKKKKKIERRKIVRIFADKEEKAGSSFSSFRLNKPPTSTPITPLPTTAIRFHPPRSACLALISFARVNDFFPHPNQVIPYLFKIISPPFANEIPNSLLTLAVPPTRRPRAIPDGGCSAPGDRGYSL